jgi:CRP-like cAMP-binding protein
MIPFPVHRFGEFSTLSEPQLAMLATLSEAPKLFRRRALIRREGDDSTGVWLLHDGWVGAAIDLPNAKRQLIKIHLPGDVLGSTSMCLVDAADTLEALTDVQASFVPFTMLGGLYDSDPRLAAAAFTLSVQKERLALMHRLAMIGRTSAYERVAGLLVDLLERGRLAGVVVGNAVSCPLTQEQIADVVGLTNVHVNRIVRRLNDDGLIDGTHGRFVVLDERRLRALVPFQPRYVDNPAWLPAYRDG